MDAPSSQVRITVQLEGAVTLEFSAHVQRSASVLSLQALIDDAGASISPTFPNVDDPELRQWFTVVVPVPRASDLLTKLQHHDAVRAAYIKPAEGMP